MKPFAASSSSTALDPAGTAQLVKGFRTPAGHGRDGGRGGRRPKSLEGGNRGELCAGGGVGLWGFRPSVWLQFSVADRKRRPSEQRDACLVGPGAVEALIWYGVTCVLVGQGRVDDCSGRSVAGAGQIAASDGSGDGGWRQGCDGHELSSPIDGIGHSRGWQPGSKVSMMIIRPPQQGQVFASSSA